MHLKSSTPHAGSLFQAEIMLNWSLIESDRLILRPDTEMDNVYLYIRYRKSINLTLWGF